MALDSITNWTKGEREKRRPLEQTLKEIKKKTEKKRNGNVCKKFSLIKIQIKIPLEIELTVWNFAIFLSFRQLKIR